MFRWYQNAVVCFVNLVDVSISKEMDMKTRNALVERSVWFKRGWTLQELLAPRSIVFFDKDWNRIGTKEELMAAIRLVTGIKPEDFRYIQLSPLERRYVRQNNVEYVTVARRMSWASNRETTRGEDMAYCLFGIFDVNMPLLYGEGQHKAFERLQLEILRHSDDESIFAWGFEEAEYRLSYGLLAWSPSAFSNSQDVVCHTHIKRKPWEVTNRGIRIKSCLHREDLFKYESLEKRKAVAQKNLLLLNCSLQIPRAAIGIPVHNESDRPLVNALEDKMVEFYRSGSAVASPHFLVFRPNSRPHMYFPLL